MSKKLKFFVMMLTCILLSINQVLATEEVAYTLTAAATGSNSSPHNSYGDAATGWSCTDANDVTISWAVIGNSYMVPWRIGVKKGTTAGSNTRYIYSETAISQNITKVIVTHGAKSGFTAVSVTLRVYSTAAKAATGGDGDISNVSVAYADNTTMTFNRPTGHNWTGRFYRLDYDLTWSYKKNDPQYILFSSAVFKYESGGSTKTVHFLTHKSACSFFHSLFLF